MNRRDFIRASATALLGFTILPGAGRVWKARRVMGLSSPVWANAAPFGLALLDCGNEVRMIQLDREQQSALERGLDLSLGEINYSGRIDGLALHMPSGAIVKCATNSLCPNGGEVTVHGLRITP